MRGAPLRSKVLHEVSRTNSVNLSQKSMISKQDALLLLFAIPFSFGMGIGIRTPTKNASFLANNKTVADESRNSAIKTAKNNHRTPSSTYEEIELKKDEIDVQELAPLTSLHSNPPVDSELKKELTQASPTPLLSPMPEAAFKPYSTFRFTPRFFYYRADAIDTASGSTASIFSNLSRDVTLTWIQNWTAKLQTLMFFGGGTIDLITPAGAPKTITNPTQSQFSFGIGTKYDIFPKLTLGASLRTKQELFLRGLGASSVSFDNIPIIQTQASARFKVFEVQPFTLGFDLGATYLSSASTPTYSLFPGSAFNGTIFMNRQVGMFDLETALQLRQSSQNTTNSNQTTTETSFLLDVGWRF